MTGTVAFLPTDTASSLNEQVGESSDSEDYGMVAVTTWSHHGPRPSGIILASRRDR
jgi:hypothetical protein